MNEHRPKEAATKITAIIVSILMVTSFMSLPVFAQWGPGNGHMRYGDNSRGFYGPGDQEYTPQYMSQVQRNGFRVEESGAVLMDDDTKKALLVAYQKRKQDEIMHPFLGEKVQIGQLFHLQALLLARFLRGDLDGYPPFIWK